VTGRPRHVFIVANNIEEIGGLQRVVHTLADGFARRGHDVELIGIVPGPGPRRISPVDPAYRMLTLSPRGEPREWRPRRPVDRLRIPSRLRERRRRRMHAQSVARLNERFRAVADGIVIVGQIWAMQWVADADTRHLRVIGMSHESYEASRGLVPTARNSTRYQRIMRYYPPVDHVLFLTAADARKFEADGLCSVGAMPNPLQTWPQDVSPLTDRVVITLGRLEPEKRYDRLLDAWVLVASRHPDWQLRIFGDGSLRPALEEQIARLDLDESAHLMGSTDLVLDELRRSSVFALSSEQEGLPLVMAEAMSCGVPCVAFDCAPGIREIIRDGEDGLVVRNRDVAALADAICRLIEDEDLRRGLGARARDNIARFRLDDVMERWERLFEVVER
jgi:glycosyltransferase involved in cell wall biosynthesis